MSRDSDQITDFQRACELRLRQPRVPLPQKRELQAPAPVQRMPEQAAPPAHQPEEFQAQLLQAEQAELAKSLQVERDRAAGLARLQQYADEQHLLETAENAALVQGWLDKNVRKEHMSANGVDAAIANLGPRGSNVLLWKPKTPPPTVAPTPSMELVETLPDGSKRLPLGTVPSHRHSIAQLRDLDERERNSRNRSDLHGGSL